MYNDAKHTQDTDTKEKNHKHVCVVDVDVGGRPQKLN